MARVVQTLSGLILAGILVHSYLLAVMLLQFYLAGADRAGAESWKWHEVWGYVIGVPILLLLVLTLIGRLGPRAIGVAALLAALFAAQLALNRVRVEAPYLPMLYAANGLAMMGLTTSIDRSRHPVNDDMERQEADSGRDEGPYRPRGGRVDNGASEHRHLKRRIPTFDVVREMSDGERAGSCHCLAGRSRYGAHSRFVVVNDARESGPVEQDIAAPRA